MKPVSQQLDSYSCCLWSPRIRMLLAQGKKPNIVILATGGTIAGAAASGTQSSYTSGAVTIDAMLDAVPGIKRLGQPQGRANRECRLAGHDLRHHAQACQAH